MRDEEFLDLADESGRVIGLAPRSLCHGDPRLRHWTVHVAVFSSDGRILLQRRSLSKRIQPGRWDTAVGGHVTHGESLASAACREALEEIGLRLPAEPEVLFDMTIANEIESERTRVFRAVSDGPFRYEPSEVSALRFWTVCEVRSAFGTGVLTPYLEEELRRLLPLLEG